MFASMGNDSFNQSLRFLESAHPLVGRHFGVLRPVWKALPLPVAARFLPSVVEGSGLPRVSHERKENGRFPCAHERPAQTAGKSPENPLRK
jgi:hypothetical protein